MIDVSTHILQITNAKAIDQLEPVQSLWSGYGEIKRVYLRECKVSSVIVKHIQLPDRNNHPRGWNTNLSHQRKLKSYQVEQVWYEDYAKRTTTNCPVPEIYFTYSEGEELLLIMEDLDFAGYDIRLHHNEVSVVQAKACLGWLASFHANFMNDPATGLWPQGTYWHLDTRPDEWSKMQNAPLKHAAKSIDQKLKEGRFQTIVHGDAKLANFCFNKENEVAAVDFQYVGKGCGMKDVAYLISSCFEEAACEGLEKELLDHYFEKLEIAVDKSIDFQLLKNEWQELYAYAWADFYRFLDGWSPGHWKMHSYSLGITREVLNKLETNEAN
ncbi:MAG: phosphotransferase [Ekhidna sp.]|nr:phosphotransferase [Ekhidna sp.]